MKLSCHGGRFVRAHRAVLSAVSPLFLKTLLLEIDPYQCKELQVCLPDIRYNDLVNLVRFIYTGEIRLSRRQSNILRIWLKALRIQLALHQSLVLDHREQKQVTSSFMATL